MKLAYQISSRLGSVHCDLHHMGISTSVVKEKAVVKVCCNYFLKAVEEQLNKHFGSDFIKDNVRLRLPASIAVGDNVPEESGEE